MIQRSFSIRSEKEIESIKKEIIESPEYSNANDGLLLAACELWNNDRLKELFKRLENYFPKLKVVGFNFHCKESLLNDESNDGVMKLSFFLFEGKNRIRVCSYPFKAKKETETGRSINQFLKNEADVKGVYILTPVYFMELDVVLKEASKGFAKIPFFGVKTTLRPECYTYFNDKENNFLAIAFCGKDLYIQAQQSLGWTPVGKIMKVTEMENDYVISRIDDIPATEIYHKYLGLKQHQITADNTCEFPLIFNYNNTSVAKICTPGLKKGHMFLGIKSKVGDEVRLSYGNPDEIFETVYRDNKKMRKFKPQGEILFACVNRLNLMKRDEEWEINLYREICPELFDLHGYAEIMLCNGKGGELNSALVSIGIREGEAVQVTSAQENDKGRTFSPEEYHKDRVEVPLEFRLLNFFKEMSADLIEAADKAEEASRAKSDFLSSVSHEIRTPINAVLGMDEMILRESKEEEIIEYAKNIQDSGKLLLGLINDLLDSARIESGRLQLIPINYEFKGMMSNIVNIVGVRADSKGLEFNINVQSTIPSVLHGDETRLTQCIINILNNAVKYTKEGSVTLTVNCEECDDRHVYLMVSVKDTGIGIKKEDLDKLYKPFERIEESKNFSIEGTGLGLTIVNRLLEMMGSRMEVRSTYGKGSEFSFKVKQLVVNAEPIGDCREGCRRGKAHTDNDYKESFRAPTATILAVDDTEMNLLVIKGLLKRTLVKVDTAQNGNLALEMIKYKKYDIILIDQRMPGMDGSELYQRISELPEYDRRQTKCIALTANAVSGIKEKFIEEGFDDYLSKPVEGKDLEAMLEKYIPKEKILSDSTNVRAEKLRIIDELNLEEAMKYCLEEEIFLEAMGAFISDRIEMSEALRKLSEENNLKEMTIKVHALKSSSKTVGLTKFSEKAEKLEKMGKEGRLDDLKQALPDLLDDYKDICVKLESVDFT